MLQGAVPSSLPMCEHTQYTAATQQPGLSTRGTQLACAAPTSTSNMLQLGHSVPVSDQQPSDYPQLCSATHKTHHLLKSVLRALLDLVLIQICSNIHADAIQLWRIGLL
jgi:hypothetical protein